MTELQQIAADISYLKDLFKKVFSYKTSRVKQTIVNDKDFIVDGCFTSILWRNEGTHIVRVDGRILLPQDAYVEEITAFTNYRSVYPIVFDETPYVTGVNARLFNGKKLVVEFIEAKL